MKPIRFVLTGLCLLLLCSCEHYVENELMNRVISGNDLAVSFSVLEDGEHVYTMLPARDDSTGTDYLQIMVENEFSISTGRAPISPGKRYEFSFTLRNHSANPVVLSSFWSGLSTTTRQNVLSGENGNPPVSQTQDIYTEWKTFSEIFEVEEGEKYLMIRVYSQEGAFYVRDVSITEL